MPAHFSAPVDDNKIRELLDKLAGMKQGSVVATLVEAAKRFKVAAESFEKLDPKEVSGLFAGQPLFHFTAVRKDKKQVEFA